jgi:putative transposase
MDKSTCEIRLAQWKQIIEQCQHRPEGQTAKQWMADNQISEKSYYYWLRKIRSGTYEQMRCTTSLPSAQKYNEVSFAEISFGSQSTESYPPSFRPAAVIKTASTTVALSDEISDRLLDRILQEVTHA